MLLKSLPSPEKHLKKQLLVCGEQVIWPVKRLDKWRPPSLCFNLTHTQSLLMCAVTQKAEVSLVFFFCILNIGINPSVLHVSSVRHV
jgi:hypothetical protein